VGVLWVSARVYRVGILMYGKRPTFPEIVKWVRHA
jgi:ABC-2 type transport system permease protein